MTFETFALISLWIFVPFLSFRFLRHIWMLVQARFAVQKWLEENAYILLSSRRKIVFKDCGSIRAAIFLLEFDYSVNVRSAEGCEQELWLVVEFVPMLGLYRGIRNLAYERPYPNGLPEIE